MKWIPNRSLLPSFVIVHVAIEEYGTLALGLEDTGHKEIDDFIVKFCQQYGTNPNSNFSVIEATYKLTEVLGGEILAIEYNDQP